MSNATEQRERPADAPANGRLLERLRRLWRGTPGVTLAEMRRWIADTRALGTFHSALWGRKVARPLTVAECETIIARIQAIRAARQGRG